MKINKGFEKLGKIIRIKPIKKPPKYQWQELALRIIEELHIPNFKRSSVFKICKEKHRNLVEKCFNDTKELCKTGDSWKYFFKIINKR